MPERFLNEKEKREILINYLVVRGDLPVYRVRYNDYATPEK